MWHIYVKGPTSLSFNMYVVPLFENPPANRNVPNPTIFKVTQWKHTAGDNYARNLCNILIHSGKNCHGIIQMCDWAIFPALARILA